MVPLGSLRGAHNIVHNVLHGGACVWLPFAAAAVVAVAVVVVVVVVVVQRIGSRCSHGLSQNLYCCLLHD